MYVPVQADDAVLTELVGVSLGLKVSRRCHLESSKLKHVEVVGVAPKTRNSNRDAFFVQKL